MQRKGQMDLKGSERLNEEKRRVNNSDMGNVMKKEQIIVNQKKM